MICPNCQAQNPEGATTCFNCGRPLSMAAAMPGMPIMTATQTAASTSLGMIIAAVAGVIVLIAFFALPYITAGALGFSISFTALQISQLGSAGLDTGGAAYLLLVWVGLLAAVAGAGLAGWQWFQSSQKKTPVSSGAARGVLLLGVVALAALVIQFVWFEIQLHNAAAAASSGGVDVSSYVGFGFGFYLMVVGALGIIGGAIMQARAK